MATTRCKFVCDGTGQIRSGDKALHSAKFSPVYDSNKESENGQFFAYTPAGSLTLGVVNEQHFTAGKQYYLDITEV
jgi:hypothetical protein